MADSGRSYMSSTDVGTNSSTDGVPKYLGGGDPAGRFTDYYPAWLDNLADDVTVEGVGCTYSIFLQIA